MVQKIEGRIFTRENPKQAQKPKGARKGWIPGTRPFDPSKANKTGLPEALLKKPGLPRFGNKLPVGINTNLRLVLSLKKSKKR